MNTSDTRATLSFDLRATEALGAVLKGRALDQLSGRLLDGVLTVTASEHRSQLRNREAAEARLVEILTAATAPPPAKRRATRPTKGSVERRLGGKQRRAEVKRLRRPSTDD